MCPPRDSFGGPLVSSCEAQDYWVSPQPSIRNTKLMGNSLAAQGLSRETRKGGSSYYMKVSHCLGLSHSSQWAVLPRIRSCCTTVMDSQQPCACRRPFCDYGIRGTRRCLCHLHLRPETRSSQTHVPCTTLAMLRIFFDDDETGMRNAWQHLVDLCQKGDKDEKRTTTASEITQHH